MRPQPVYRQGPAIGFDPALGRRFLVTIDTEEDFDWGAPFSRTAHSLASTAALAEGQTYFHGAGVNPLYLVDYPVAFDTTARDILGRAAADGEAEIGLQLHPWVTPPFEEAVNAHNSYTGNLPAALERAKLRALYDAAVEGFAVQPRSYRAGRYGLGSETMAILAELGVACDTSVRAHYDYRAAGGPDYSTAPLRPFWTGPDNSIAELPLTSPYVGLLRRFGGPLFHSVTDRSRVRSLLSRLRLVERVPLTPEGTTAAEAVAAIAECAALDLPVLVLSFHSPSLAPGNTPYVRDAADLAKFYGWWDKVLRALSDHGYAAASLDQILSAICPDGESSPLAKRSRAPLSP
ncbi:WalW protein [Sphingorhabdus soli]|uniref:WalW protein n=1 Tax=Flavisphingopyxis soli TaxID=2601267 RepID=A0A5C6UBB5_9SPHN|nr:polysaccharide deacetylase family protein [Sphingorhabdus soli]TXC69195.1 WalW protein [Sphingorhabdus soli]